MLKLSSRLCNPILPIAWSIAAVSKFGHGIFGEIVEEVVVLLFEFEVDGRLLDSVHGLSLNISSIEGVFLSPNVLMAVAIARDSTKSSSEFLIRFRVESRSLKCVECC